MVKYLEISTVKPVLRVLKFILWNRPTEFQNLLLFKRSYEQNLSCENEYLHGFVLSLALKQTLKWPISFMMMNLGYFSFSDK